MWRSLHHRCGAISSLLGPGARTSTRGVWLLRRAPLSEYMLDIDAWVAPMMKKLYAYSNNPAPAFGRRVFRSTTCHGMKSLTACQCSSTPSDLRHSSWWSPIQSTDQVLQQERRVLLWGALPGPATSIPPWNRLSSYGPASKPYPLRSFGVRRVPTPRHPFRPCKYAKATEALLRPHDRRE